MNVVNAQCTDKIYTLETTLFFWENKFCEDIFVAFLIAEYSSNHYFQILSERRWTVKHWKQ